MSNRPTTLIPGYTQVETFGPDEDYEDEEEEICYVTLDLGNVEPTLVPSSSTYRLIGLDTPTPYLQLSGTILKGRHNHLLGTELLFSEDKDAHDWNKRSIVHVANMEQRICFKEVQLKPKSKPVENDQENENGNDNEEIQVLDGNESDRSVAHAQSQSSKPRGSSPDKVDIDLLTGQTISSPRASRTARGEKGKGRKVTATASAKKMEKEKSKGKVKNTGDKLDKGKGKERAIESNELQSEEDLMEVDE